MASVLTVCFIAPSKSYALVDADKVVGILSWAAESDFFMGEDLSDDLRAVSIPSLSIRPSATPSPSLPLLPVISPISCLSSTPFVVPSPELSVSPFISESPDLMGDVITVSKVKDRDEEMFLESISRAYEAFFKKFKLEQERIREVRLFRNSKFFQFFKYAVLVSLFENAIKRVKIESVSKYREKWWYRMIFSCTDDEMHYYEEVYPEFEKYSSFRSLAVLSF